MIDQAELGLRLKRARESCGLTQEDVAQEMGMVRPTIAQIELGNRSVSGLELANFSYLYARDIREFLADSFDVESLASVLLRADDDAGDGVKAALRDCIALGHQLRDLETLLDISRSTNSVAAYPSVSLGSKWDAIQSGTQAALEERRRLGLGSAPLGDLPVLLEAQGIRTGLVAMPPGISGLMISHQNVGLFVVVNRDHPAVRQRFSWCHEYAHLLLDRAQMGHVSRESERTDLLEVRANVFAANFLMPEEGVRQFVGTIGKGSASRLHADIFDESGVVPIDSRTAGGSQDLQIYDVVKLAHYFGVSLLSALYRLLNLKLVTDKQFEAMKQLDLEGLSKQLADLLGLPELSRDETVSAFHRRYLVLALEAYRREKISRRKLLEIAGKLGVEGDEVERVVEGLGLDHDDHTEVLIPSA
ncbi:MAG TPA: XRE family transcriptional regulator [Candidatus Dormibacteraeota bacterium]|nr:XRE family transcriptional regulator [Terriglobales bacterium]HYM79405.1 XRE family transcriptional regulator [Candidatus Dormibacteraeota bacterium]